MKVSTIKMSDILKSPGLRLDAKYYLEKEKEVNVSTDDDAKSFGTLSEQTKDDLKTWYNRRELNKIDKQRLFRLYKAGKFQAWDCPECGDRIYEGHPNSWDNFQGVSYQVDYVFYPGDYEKYNPEYIMQMCDYCRCHS